MLHIYRLFRVLAEANKFLLHSVLYMPPKSQIILTFRLPKFSFHSIWDLGFGIIWDLEFWQLVIWDLGFGIWDFGIWILNLGSRYTNKYSHNHSMLVVYHDIFHKLSKGI